MMSQTLLFILSLIAVFLSQQSDIKYRKWACIFGFVSQPFWIYETYVADDQWGMFLLSCAYVLVWVQGFYNFWIKPRRCKVSK